MPILGDWQVTAASGAHGVKTVQQERDSMASKNEKKRKNKKIREKGNKRVDQTAKESGSKQQAVALLWSDHQAAVSS